MKEWRYLVFLVKYHLNRWIREKKQGGVFYIGGERCISAAAQAGGGAGASGATGRRGGCDGKSCSD